MCNMIVLLVVVRFKLFFVITAMSVGHICPMIPLCCTQAKCEQKESGSHTCTCPDGYAGDGFICYGSLMDVSIQTSII